MVRACVRSDIVRRIAAGALHHPDMIVLIDGYSADLCHDPVVRQFLRPERIHFVMRLRLGGSAGTKSDQADTGNNREDSSATAYALTESVPRANQHEAILRFCAATGAHRSDPG